LHSGRKTGRQRTSASHLEGQGPGRRMWLPALNSACALRFRCRQSRFLRGCHRRTALYGNGHIGITHILPEHRAIAFLLSDWLESEFDLPEPDVPDLREDTPETAALSLRHYWGIGERPIKNMIHLLELKGIRVFFARGRWN
jgi:hypothetical protein